MGGYTWHRNSRLNRVTSWQNSAFLDVPSEIIYMEDLKTNKKWSLGLNPMPDENDYNILITCKIECLLGTWGGEGRGGGGNVKVWVCRYWKSGGWVLRMLKFWCGAWSYRKCFLPLHIVYTSPMRISTTESAYMQKAAV